MSYDKLMQKIAAGKFDNLYLLYGEETYLINQFLKDLKAKVLEDASADFNYDNFYIGSADCSHVRDTIDTLPMFASKRMIVIRSFHSAKEKDLSALMPVLENPVDSSVVVLVADKIDKRKKVYKTIQKSGQMVECKRLYDNQVMPWIQHIASQYGLRLDSQAAELMHQSVGNNLIDIDNEMLKLQQYLGERTDVDVATVSKVVSHSRVESVFELANAIGSNDRAQALVRLAQLLDQGQNEVGVLAMVIRHFRILSDLREGMKSGLKGSKLGQSAGIHPYFLNQYVDQCRAWTDNRIRRTFSALLETDKALKSSPVSSHIWLENFVIKTCQP